MVDSTRLNWIVNVRTALFTPADRPERVGKAWASSADAIIVDLEDAVAPSNKAQARDSLLGTISALPSPTAGTPGLIIRINSPLTAEGKADLTVVAGILRSHSEINSAVMIPKAADDGAIDYAYSMLPPDTPLIALVESASGLSSLTAVASHEGVTRLAFGAVDLSAQLGCIIESDTIYSARSSIVIASAASELPPPLESPCTNFRDSNEVTTSAQRAFRNGFGGMLCIHPAQLAPVAQAFMPDESDLAWARSVLSAGDSASGLDGQMIDTPVIRRAERIVDLSERCSDYSVEE